MATRRSIEQFVRHPPRHRRVLSSLSRSLRTSYFRDGRHGRLASVGSLDTGLRKPSESMCSSSKTSAGRSKAVFELMSTSDPIVTRRESPACCARDRTAARRCVCPFRPVPRPGRRAADQSVWSTHSSTPRRAAAPRRRSSRGRGGPSRPGRRTAGLSMPSKFCEELVRACTAWSMAVIR